MSCQENEKCDDLTFGKNTLHSSQGINQLELGTQPQMSKGPLVHPKAHLTTSDLVP